MTTKKEDAKVEREINKGLAIINSGNNAYSDNRKIENIENSFIHTNYGICNSCDSFFATIKEFKGNTAICDYNQHRTFFLNPSDPILKCSRYEKANTMSITEMREIATLINPDKKDKIGLV